MEQVKLNTSKELWENAVKEAEMQGVSVDELISSYIEMGLYYDKMVRLSETEIRGGIKCSTTAKITAPISALKNPFGLAL